LIDQPKPKPQAVRPHCKAPSMPGKTCNLHTFKRESAKYSAILLALSLLKRLMKLNRPANKKSPKTSGKSIGTNGHTNTGRTVAGGATGVVLGAMVGGPLGAIVGGVVGTAIGNASGTAAKPRAGQKSGQKTSNPKPTRNSATAKAGTQGKQVKTGRNKNHQSHSAKKSSLSVAPRSKKPSVTSARRGTKAQGKKSANSK